MKTWDLTSGAAKLELAMQSLQAASAMAEEYWSDDAYRKFRETYIEPMEPKVRNVLDAIHRLRDLLTSAESQCGVDRMMGD
jgi:hypothetical protein